MRGALGEALKALRVARPEAAALVGGATQGLQAASDAAHARWVKLLAARFLRTYSF